MPPEVVTECHAVLTGAREAMVNLGCVVSIFIDEPKPEMDHESIAAAYDFFERALACVGLIRDLVAFHFCWQRAPLQALLPILRGVHPE